MNLNTFRFLSSLPTFWMSNMHSFLFVFLSSISIIISFPCVLFFFCFYLFHLSIFFSVFPRCLSFFPSLFVNFYYLYSFLSHFLLWFQLSIFLSFSIIYPPNVSIFLSSVSIFLSFFSVFPSFYLSHFSFFPPPKKLEIEVKIPLVLGDVRSVLSSCR